MPAIKTIAAGKLLCLDVAGPNWVWEESFGRLLAFGQERRIPLQGEPSLLIYGSEPFDRDQAHWTAAMALAGEATGDGDVMVITQPAMRVAYEIHQGPYETLPGAYAELFRWIQEQGYAGGVPRREIYLVGPGAHGLGDPAGYRTEIQIPITRRPAEDPEAHGA